MLLKAEIKLNSRNDLERVYVPLHSSDYEKITLIFCRFIDRAKISDIVAGKEPTDRSRRLRNQTCAQVIRFSGLFAFLCSTFFGALLGGLLCWSGFFCVLLSSFLGAA